MELRQLRSFVAVADELHFSRAADRLGVGQPTLSQHLRQLEGEIGGELLARTTRAVALTGAGRVLRDEGRAVLDGVERIRAAALKSADDRSGPLRVGVFASADMSVLPQVLRDLRRGRPNVTVELREATTLEQLAALRARKLDGGIVHGPLDSDDLASRTLVHEPMMATIPADHALAGHEPLALEALAGEPFILFARERAPALYDKFVADCRARGFTPRVAHAAGGMISAVAMVGARLGVTLLPESIAALPHPGATFVRLAEPVPTIPLLLVWRRDTVRPPMAGTDHGVPPRRS